MRFEFLTVQIVDISTRHPMNPHKTYQCWGLNENEIGEISWDNSLDEYTFKPFKQLVSVSCALLLSIGHFISLTNAIKPGDHFESTKIDN